MDFDVKISEDYDSIKLKTFFSDTLWHHVEVSLSNESCLWKLEALYTKHVNPKHKSHGVKDVGLN